MLSPSFVIAMILAATPLVHSINEYPTIGNVPKPSTCNNSGTLPAGGWLANKHCGYVMGTAIAGQKFDVESTTGDNYHYGRYRGTGGNFCSYLVPSALDTNSGTSIASSCSTATASSMCDRRSFGKDFDSAPHEGDGSIVVPLTLSGCAGYYNYFTESTFAGGTFQDQVPFSMASLTAGGYRYTTNDGKASMVRGHVAEYDQTLWFFVPRSCIASQLPATLNNDAGDGC